MQLKHSQEEPPTNHRKDRTIPPLRKFESGQLAILESIATGKSLETVLTDIVNFIEDLEEGLWCSILLLSEDRQRISRAISTSLPHAYNQAIEGMKIGPKVGSCGAAAYLGQRVVAEDILTHPNWADGAEYAHSFGLRSCWSSPIFDSDGRVVGTFAIYRKEPSRPTPLELDWVEKATYLASIAIEKQCNEDRLKVSEERYRIVTESVTDGIFAATNHYEITFANHGLARMFGYQKDDLIGRNMLELLTEIYDADLNEISKPNNPYSTSECRNNRIEAVGLHSNGQTFPVEISFGKYDLHDESYYSGMIRDITMHKQAENSLLEAKRKLEMANHAKNSFIANMSHEVRTPLSVILGYASLMAKESISADLRRSYLEIVNRNGNSLRQIIDSVLDMAKLESGEMSFVLHETSVKALIADVVSSFEELAERKGIRLSAEIAPETQSLFLTDQLRARQILMNIVGNAMKFTEKGRVTIAVYPEQNPDGDVMVAFEVTDTGPGISKKDAEALFQKFSQVDGTLSRKHPGTGLGLVLARQFARRLGGDVNLLQSDEGHGTTFKITLSQKPSGIPNSSRRKPSQPNTTGTPNEAGTLEGVRILLVEDSYELQQLFTILLSQLRVEVTVADNGRDGVEYAKHGDFDLVFMDLQMPILNGYEATKRLRELGFEKPVVALSAHAMEEEKNRALASGCSDHLCKPVDKDTLYQTIQHHLDQYS